MLKKIYIDYKDFELDEEVMERNSLVMHPAHERKAHFFDKQSKPTFFADDEKRMIVGVAIEANKEIYRAPNPDVPYEHYVIFTPETIEYIRNSFHKSSNFRRINFDHTGDDAEQLILVQSYIVGGDDNPSLPKSLQNQDIADGSWILGYYCEDEKLWNKIKSKGYTGFSVEVYTYLNLNKNFFNKSKKQIKMKKKRKSIFDYFKSKFETNSIVDLDGNTYNYDDEEIVVGTTILHTLNEEGEEVPASNLETIVSIKGADIAISTDENGVVTAMADVEEEPEVVEEILDEFTKVVRQQFQERDAELNRIRNDFQAQIDELKAEIKKINVKGKFNNKRANNSTTSKKSAVDFM